MRVLLVVLTALLLAPTAQALIVAQPSRFDVGDLAPGASWEGVVTVTNKGAQPASVEASLSVLENEAFSVEPARRALAPGESATFTLRLLVPSNASGGRHDPRVDLVEVPSGGGTTVGRAAVGVPVVFRVHNLKVGNLEVRHPLPGEDAEARILVQNFLDAPVEADVTLQVLDASGASVAQARGRTERTEPNASTSLALALPTKGLPAGAYVVRGEATHGPHGGNAWETPLFVGERRLVLSDVVVRAGPDGRVVFTAKVGNAGTVPMPGDVAFLYGPKGSPSRSVAASAGLLRPGDLRAVTAELVLPPGDYEARASTRWAGGEAEVRTDGFTVRAPAASTPFPAVALLAGLALAAFARRRRD